MPISIKSKREGFRRCGIPHSANEITYPDDRFTLDEIAILQAEPMLIVKRAAIESIKDAIEIDTEVPAHKSRPKSRKK